MRIAQNVIEAKYYSSCRHYGPS